MRIGIFGGDAANGPVDALVDLATRAAGDGFPTFWLPQIFGVEALAALALIGREVGGIELGTAVVPTYPRHPVVLAQQALTTQSAVEPASFAGETLAGHATLDVQGATPVPILVAALGPKMLELTGQVADGTVTWMTGPVTIASHIVPTIGAAASGAGRPAPRVVVGLPVCVTSDVAAARERAARNFQMYGQLPSYRAMLDREGV